MNDSTSTTYAHFWGGWHANRTKEAVAFNGPHSNQINQIKSQPIEHYERT
jgi:hypothetical protein